jgi:hypothetical protein
MASEPASTASAERSGRWWWGVVRAVLRHPSLWSVAVGQLVRMARPGWWHRAPFLPIPDRSYLAFRLETMYGTGTGPAPDDVVTYLRWCRQYRQLT